MPLMGLPKVLLTGALLRGRVVMYSQFPPDADGKR